MRWSTVIRSGLISGSYASVASTAALAVAARAEGKGAWQPINATSHWRNGDAAAGYRDVDLRHTAIGYATNHAACIFWALCFETWRSRRRAAGPMPMLGEAALMAVIAAAVDYGPTPRRFTPGWELVLSKKGMAVAYAGLALGLAAGASRTQTRRGHCH
ncbi:MAG: hypothetical protein RQ966_05675 [Acetobacteraceae bacterium]|nr:hypothetical protein [Acetobacteraceae bacterium]